MPESPPACPGPSALCAAEIGCTVRLCALDVAGGERLRLAEFGLRPGAVLTLLSRTAGGGRLIGLGTSRIALDRGTTRHLLVEAA